jgi:GR25 family glycosyltransferase involved in LPS biosynthesis
VTKLHGQQYWELEKAYNFGNLALFLPYNPTVLTFSQDPEILATCESYWPQGRVISAKSNIESKQPFDFIWIDNEYHELKILTKNRSLLEDTSVVYTSIHAEYFQSLETFLHSMGFKLLAPWNLGESKGYAAFIKSDLMNAVWRTLNYSPRGIAAGTSYPLQLAPFLHKIDKPSLEHPCEEIDFIYMINLDERPEKLELTLPELQLYNIHPYRFSAVNGWNLPLSVINQLGVRFYTLNSEELFMGSIFKDTTRGEVTSNEQIRADDRAYFTIGMSRGSIGIILSHLSILQDAYDSGFECIWIMEDDVEVISDPRQIPQLIRELNRIVPDWDILFTDTDTKLPDGIHVPCRAIGARPNLAILPLSTFMDNFYAVTPHIFRIGMRYGAYSMIVHRSGMEKILNYFKTYGIFLPYDMDYWLIPDLKMYSPNRDIVSHRPGALSDNGAPNYKDL